MEENNKSPHILNTSSNLLGLCFVVLSSIKIMKVQDETFIDELTTVSTILFMASCILSFMSMRNSFRKSKTWEDIADYLFLTGLGLLFITVISFTFNIIQ
jgi:hypothetical protein